MTSHGFLQGRPYYQGKTGDLSSGKKYFYNLGDSRGRQAAKLKSGQSTVVGSGAKFKIIPYVGELRQRRGNVGHDSVQKNAWRCVLAI